MSLIAAVSRGDHGFDGKRAIVAVGDGVAERELVRPCSENVRSHPRCFADGDADVGRARDVDFLAGLYGEGENLAARVRARLGPVTEATAERLRRRLRL